MADQPVSFQYEIKLAVTLEAWALLYEDAFYKRESINLSINGQPRQIMITEMQLQPKWTEDKNVYLTGRYDSRSMEQQ